MQSRIHLEIETAVILDHLRLVNRKRDGVTEYNNLMVNRDEQCVDIDIVFGDGMNE